MAGNAVAVLRNILADAAIVKLLTIKEGISGVQLFCGERRITVLDVPENSIAINMHIASPRTGGILPQERRARTHSDYAIIGTADNQDFIAYIEASDTSAQRSDTEKRLREAVCVMDYCAAIAREFQDSDGLLAGYRRHFVKIKAHGRINRRFNFSSRLLENDSPGNLRVLEGVEIPFRYLIA